jgi:hypothetical protein
MQPEDEKKELSSSGGQIIQNLPQKNNKPDCTLLVQSGFSFDERTLAIFLLYAHAQ